MEKEPKDLAVYLSALDVEMRQVLEQISEQFDRVQTLESQVALKEMMISHFKETLESVTLTADTFLDDEVLDAERSKLN